MEPEAGEQVVWLCISGSVQNFCIQNDHRLCGYIPITCPGGRDHAVYLVHHIGAPDNLAEDRVAPLGSFGIEKIVIRGVDEKLGCGRMGTVCPGHGNGVFFVLQPVFAFVFNGSAGFFGLHVRREASPLDHEAFNDPVEDGAFVKAAFHVRENIGNRVRCLAGVELKDNTSFRLIR